MNPIALYLISLAIAVLAYAGYAQIAVPLIEGETELVRREIAEPVEAVDRTSQLKQEIAWLFPADGWEHGKCKILTTVQGKILFQDYERLDDGMIDVFPFTLVLDPDPATADSEPEMPTVMRALRGARLKLDKPLSGMSGEAGRIQQAQLAGQVIIYRNASSPAEDDGLQIVTSNVQIDQKHIYTLEEVDFRFGPNSGHGRNLLIELKSSTPVSGGGGLSDIDGFKKIELAFLSRLRLDPRGNSPSPAAAPVSTSDTGSRRQVLGNRDAPIDVQCAGPFVFDMDANTAVFNKTVRVRQDDQYGDTLSCERLNLTFESSGPMDAPERPDAESSFSRSLKLKRLVAIGGPSRIDAHSRQSTITGDRIDYNLANGHFVVSGERGATISTPENSFQGAQLSYIMPDNDSIGPLDAIGAGEMTGLMKSTDPGKPDNRTQFSAKWSRQLTVRPADGNRQLITIDGAADIRLDRETTIRSDNIQMLVQEIESRDRQGDTTREMVPIQMTNTGDVNIQSPQLAGTARQMVVHWPAPGLNPPGLDPRMPVNGNGPREFAPPAGDRGGEFNFEQQNFQNSPTREPEQQNPSRQDGIPSLEERFGISNVIQNPDPNRLAVRRPTYRQDDVPHQPSPDQLTFVRQSPGQQSQSAGLVPPSPRTATYQFDDAVAPVAFQQPVPPRNGGPLKSDRQFRFDGDKVEVSLGPVDQGSPVLDLTIEGNVLVNEIPSGDEPPIKISGGRLNLVPHNDLYVMHVLGRADQPALIDTGQLKLSGPDVRFDQPGNRVSVLGAGEMSLAGSKPGTNLDIAWKESMKFDGQLIEIERDVVMSSIEPTDDGGRQQTNSRGHRLKATLKRRVSLQQRDRTGQPPAEIDQLFLHNKGSRGGFALVSDTDELTAAEKNVAIYNRTFDAAGNLQSHMEFIVPTATVQSGGSQLTAHGPGIIINRSRGEQDFSLSVPGAQKPDNDDQITYTQINFDGPFSADMKENKIRVSDNVRTIYSPVPNWQQSLNPDDTVVPENAVRLTCDQINVDTWQRRDQEKPTSEMVASGNSNITSPELKATADRISYDEANDMLVIEGTPRTKAHLWYLPKSKPGTKSNWQDIIAGKILYRPSDQWTHWQGISSGNITTDRRR